MLISTIDSTQTFVINFNAYQVTEGSLTINVIVGVTSVIATLDSGAGISLINFENAREFPRVQQHKYKLQAINWKPLTNYGFAIVPLRIGTKFLKYPMLIVKGCQCPVLLGYDFLESYRCTIDINRAEVLSDTLGSIPFANNRKDILDTLPSDLKASLHASSL